MHPTRIKKIDADTTTNLNKNIYKLTNNLSMIMRNKSIKKIYKLFGNRILESQSENGGTHQP